MSRPPADAFLGPMRNGTLNRQYKDPAEKRGAYWQISYTHQMRSRPEYVRPEHLKAVRAELANFRKFRRLAERWIELSPKLSKAKRKPPSLDKAQPYAKARQAEKVGDLREAPMHNGQSARAGMRSRIAP